MTTHQICPQCGHVEPDPTARYCDLDGAELVAAPPPPLAPTTPLTPTTPTPLHPDRRPPAQAPRPERPHRGGLLLALLGLGMLAGAVALVLHAPDRLDPSGLRVELGLADPTAAESSPTAAPASTRTPSDARAPVQPSAPAPDASARTPADLLRRCFGDPVPPIPRLTGGPEAQAFELFKGTLRIGTQVGAAVAAPPLSPADERAAGATIARQLEQRTPLAADRALQERLARVVARLTPHTTRRGELTYRFRVLDSPEFNAFMAPGGRGYAYRGLLQALPAEDELAFVVAHELAHGELGHPSQLLRVALAGRTLGGGVLGPGGDELGELLAGVAGRVLELSYDQDLEFEADRLGACLLALAGLDPAAPARAMTVIAAQEAQPATPPAAGAARIAYDVITTHPPVAERRAYLLRLRDRLQPGAAR